MIEKYQMERLSANGGNFSSLDKGFCGIFPFLNGEFE
jgi:hypothetical protein